MPGRRARSLRTLEKTKEDGERKFVFEKSTVNVKLLSPVPPNGLAWPVSQLARWSPTCLFPGPTFSQAPPSSTSSLRWETSKSSLIQCLSSPLPASSQLPTGSCHFSSHCKSRPFLSTHSLGSTRVLLLQTRTPALAQPVSRPPGAAGAGPGPREQHRQGVALRTV